MIRTWRDETGIALGLAVILVVLMGVLAAGFLAVVRSDLLSTISANHGQRAFDLADAGSRAAAAHLRSDPTPNQYDANASENSEWSHVSPDGDPPGKLLSLDDGSTTVTIRYLLPATEEDQQEDENHAPEPVPDGLSDYPGGDYFLVTSEGVSGETRRKVEVILHVSGPGEVGRWSWREVYE